MRITAGQALPSMSGVMGTGTAKADQGLRKDFLAALGQRLSQSFGAPGSPLRQSMETVFPAAVTDKGVDLTKVPAPVIEDLQKLQKASQQMEAQMVKGLLDQMHKSAAGSDDSSMADFANDLMDQNVAESVSSGTAGLGIAKTVFVSMGDRVVREAAVHAAASTKTGN